MPEPTNHKAPELVASSSWQKATRSRWHYCYDSGGAYCGSPMNGDRQSQPTPQGLTKAACCQICLSRYEYMLKYAAQENARRRGTQDKKQLSLF